MSGPTDLDTVSHWQRPELKARTLTAAFGLRPALTPLLPVTPALPVVAYSRTADQLYLLLRHLAPEEWMAPTRTGYGSVRDVVAHLAGVESVVLSWIGHGPPIDPALTKDHAASTAPMMTALSGAPVEAVVRRWRMSSARFGAACRSVGGHTPVLAHDIPTDVEGLLVLRTFELWSHIDDICQATGRPRPRLDPGRLALLSQRLIQVLPLAVALLGVEVPEASVRLVLTGDGGGSYVVSLTERPASGGPASGGPASRVTARIVTDVTDFCRHAARRLDRADLVAGIDGDGRVADLVLAATRAFARD